MILNNFYKCPLCLKDPCCEDNSGRKQYMPNYINCDNCIRYINSSDNIEKFFIYRYTLNVVQDDYFSIKLEKYNDQIISIYLNKYDPDIKIVIIDSKDYLPPRSIHIPYKDKVYGSDDLIKIINKVDNYQSLI